MAAKFLNLRDFRRFHPPNDTSFPSNLYATGTTCGCPDWETVATLPSMFSARYSASFSEKIANSPSSDPSLTVEFMRRYQSVIFINVVVNCYQLGSKGMSKSVQLDQRTINSCAVVHAAWNEITRTWTLPTIHALGLKEPARFNELKRRINGISATSLAERLTQLEKVGVIQRKVYADVHPRIEYSLTVKGHEVYAILCDLAKWAQRWAGKEPNSREFIVSK